MKLVLLVINSAIATFSGMFKSKYYFIKIKISCYEFAENQQPLVGYYRNRFKASLRIQSWIHHIFWRDSMISQIHAAPREVSNLSVPRTSHFWSFSVHIVPALRLVKAHELLNSLNLSHIKKQNKVIKDRSIGELKSVEIGMDPSQNTDILVAIDLSHRNHTLWLILYELDCHEYKNIQIKLILFKNWSEIWIGILSCRHPIIQNCSPC